MASNSQRIFRTRGADLILQALRTFDGQDARLLRSEDAYAGVTDHLWGSLPVPIRLLGKERLQWRQIVEKLKQRVFLEREGVIRFPANAKTLIANILKECGTEDDALTISDTSVKRTVLGIDLGTTATIAAFVDSLGMPRIVPFKTEKHSIPSIVYFDNGNVLVGSRAIESALDRPQNAAWCVKRDMGAKSYHQSISDEWLPPEVIASMILRTLRRDAEHVLGQVDEAVITVPAYFDEPKRRATMDAARMAGIKVLDIINEPIAAAIAYGWASGLLDPAIKAAPQNVLIYDLGGGTFDVSIVRIEDYSFKTIATDGDYGLGGKDWDDQLAHAAASQFQSRFGFNLLADPIAYQRLLFEAQAAKHVLSENERASIRVEYEGNKLRVNINRHQFEQATAGMLARTQATTQAVLVDAGLSWKDVDRIILVGGATRMPMVRRMLEAISNRPVDSSLNPDEAVALGAALYAERLVGRSDKPSKTAKFQITNVNAHSLGIEGISQKTKTKKNRILIRKNTPLPAAKTRSFRTLKPNQRSVSIVVLEGESRDPKECTRVGKLKLANLPPNLPAGWPIHITYRYAENGRLDVSAQLKGKLGEVSATFVRDNSLPEGDLLLWAEYVEHSTANLEL